MKTKKQFFKENWLIFLIMDMIYLPVMFYPLYLLFKGDLKCILVAIVMLWVIILSVSISNGYRDYKIDELEKQINELKSK